MQSIRMWAGIDVSARKLAVRGCREGKEQEREFSNDAEGHRDLRKWLGKNSRVCLEATGVYHLQLALMLVGAGVEVMVINPRVAKDFGRALANRSKTDKVDAGTLLEYVRRMEFVDWQAPREARLFLSCERSDAASRNLWNWAWSRRTMFMP
jgi:transposase